MPAEASRASSASTPGKAREDAPRIALENGVAFGIADIERVDITLGIVEIMARRRINTAHRADHFRSEQDILVVDHVRQQVDARLMIDAGVEEDVVHEMRVEAGLLQHIGKTPITSPGRRRYAGISPTARQPR
ncbi:hypothetical protein K426_21614 [Sphingobium sp. TKS]|nr:hypothetical protein K426_21614 [Sphingobium sp. TKS]